MEKATKSGFAGRSMVEQTAEIAEAGQLIHETAVDQESNDGQERRLSRHRAPAARRVGLDDRAGYSAQGEKRGDDGDDDGSIAEDDLSPKLY